MKSLLVHATSIVNQFVALTALHFLFGLLLCIGVSASETVPPNGAVDTLLHPTGIVLDSSGNIFVADWEKQVIRKISQDGKMTTLAGLENTPGSFDGQGTDARFDRPQALTIDAENNLYVADTMNDAIRKITPSGYVTTVAGLLGYQKNPILSRYHGDRDGDRFSGQFNLPNGIATDGRGTFYVTTQLNLMKVTSDGTVTTLVKGLNSPSSVAVDQSGDIYVADVGGESAIKKVTPDGKVTVFAGEIGNYPNTKDGERSSARFGILSGIVIDKDGTIYVADRSYHQIKRINKQGVVDTLAGNPHGVDDKDAQFKWLWGLAVDPSNNVYVTDVRMNSIRAVSPDGVVTTIVENGKLVTR